MRIEDGELRVGARSVPLLSGEVHFFRSDPRHWDDLLESAAAAGLPLVSTYLSWRRHEPRRGDIDLSGATDPRLDVRRFIERCAAHGLLVHLKPGPWICAEEVGGGLPDWLLEDRELWALDAAGEPILGYNPPWRHRVPSYLHPRYLGHVRRWFRAVDRHLEGLFFPDGPIALVQLDNEPSYMFRDTPSGFDYHPVTIERYRRWLERRYRSPGAIERAWGAPVTDIAGVEPPRQTAEIPSQRDVDWTEFRELLIADYLRRLRRYHQTAGVGGALFTANYNDHPIASVPQDGWRIARAIGGTGGPDLYYVPPIDRSDLERLARTVAIARTHDPALAWAPEMQAGIWRVPGQPTADPTPDELEFWWLAAIAFGLRGLNLYMLADREHWTHAPLRADGSPGPLWPAVQRLVALVQAIPEWGKLIPMSPVAIYRDQALWRRSYAVSDSAGDSPNGSADQASIWNQIFGVLLRAGYLPTVWDSRAGPPREARALVIPGSTKPGPSRPIGLRTFADRGGVILELGAAERAVAQRSREPNTPAERVATPELLMTALRQRGIVPPLTVDDPHTVAVRARADDDDVLFLVRDARVPAMISVSVGGRPCNLVPIDDGPRVESNPVSTSAIDMPGRAVRVFRITPGSIDPVP